MTYGTVVFDVLHGSISITKKKNQQVRHYPGTDSANYASLGRAPTIITCTIITKSKTERILIEQLMHDDEQRELHLTEDGFYYKNVVTGESSSAEPQTSDGLTWFIEAEFIALDPIPYDIDTGGALY